MKEQITKVVTTTKEYWAKQPKKKKIIIGVSAGGVLVLAIVITVLLNLSSGGYQVLFPNIEQGETAQVYAVLQEMGVPTEVNQKGEVMVPKEQWDELVFQLAGKGFPQTAPGYGVFLDNTGFTKTEFEKQQVLLFQLQNRMQETLARVEGIESAVVNFNIVQDSGYVWDEKTEESTASVLVTPSPGRELSNEMVSAIRNLVSFSVPKMQAKNVKVIDAKTGVELDPTAGTAAEGGYDFKRLEFEREIERNYEDSVKRLLSGRYGPDGVTVVANATLNYDKMLTENYDLEPEDDGNGVKTHYEDQYSLSGEVPAAGIVGEENNTDLPTYANQDGATGTGGATDFRRSMDYDIGYIKRQIEKNQAVVEKVTLSVVVNDSEFTQEKIDTLTSLISNAVSVEPDYITVSNLDFSEEPEAEQAGTEPEGGLPENLRMYLIIGAAALLFLVLVAVVLVILLRRRAKKKAAAAAVESETVIHDLQAEIDARKKELAQEAEANSKDSAITNEVREFAKQNPEITASLIRSWLKEDE